MKKISPLYKTLRPLLFLQDSETIHHRMMRFGRLLGRVIQPFGFLKKFVQADARLETEVMGLKFPSPIGLAAGFDKQAELLKLWPFLGPGFVEIGTVTPLAQEGNPKPRLFRLVEDEAVINRMGFNNEGLDSMVEKLKNEKPQGLIVGGNIGKNKNTPNEWAAKDYALGLEKLHPYVDYFVVNVSSPNTANLRALQEKEPLMELLTGLQNIPIQKENPKAILVKIAPDIEEAMIPDFIEVFEKTGIAGFVISNTTLSREGLHTPAEKLAEIGDGGLSGAPVREKSTALIAKFRQALGPNRGVIIGVGGVFNADHAIEKFKAGANLVQIYTGMIYEGPTIFMEIHDDLCEKMHPSQ